MGSNQSSLDGKYVNMIRDQFNKLKDGDKNYLVLEQIVKLKAPSPYQLDFTDVSVIFLFDSNLNGFLTFDDLKKGVEVFAKYYSDHGSNIYKNQFTGLCICNLCNAMKEKGEGPISAWLLSLITNSLAYRKSSNYTMNVVELLYNFLKIEQTSGVPFDRFSEILKGYLVKKENNPDIVPKEMILNLSRQYLSGVGILVESVLES